MNKIDETKFFHNKIVLITGATGLIGQALVKYFLSVGAKIYAQVRNIEKAERLFEDAKNIKYICGDIKTVKYDNYSVDYIIHTASPTSSKGFVLEPVETIDTLYLGTKNLLEYAKTCKKLQRLIYLSTMEVYGTPQDDNKIDELHFSNIETTAVRSCYPEGKRLCENLCIAYSSEYAVPLNILRLTQTFGPGVAYNDGRVFAEFARCVMEGKDIILRTKGETCRNYLHIYDAISAIATVIEKAPIGELYNVANETTYCSIYEMATFVAEKIANGNICVNISEEANDNFGYAPILHMNLDTNKLRGLGWMPEKDMKSMFVDMIEDMKKQL